MAALRNGGQAQIQEFVPGYDLDLSLLADGRDVKAWAIHKRSSDKLGATLPSCRFVEHDGLLEIGKRLVRATGFRGLAHIDGRFDERTGEVKLIECNPRAYDSIQFAAFAGVNFITTGLHFGEHSALAARCTQVNGVVNSPVGMLRLLLKRSEGIPIWTPGTRRAWEQLIRDPGPWAVDLSRMRALS